MNKLVNAMLVLNVMFWLVLAGKAQGFGQENWQSIDKIGNSELKILASAGQDSDLILKDAISFRLLEGGAVVLRFRSGKECLVGLGLKDSKLAKNTNKPESDTNHKAILILANYSGHINADSPTSYGTAVSYTIPKAYYSVDAVTDTYEAPGVVVYCNPPSGSHFSTGTTLVTCAGTDGHGSHAYADINITVREMKSDESATDSKSYAESDEGAEPEKELSPRQKLEKITEEFISKWNNSEPDLLDSSTLVELDNLVRDGTSLLGLVDKDSKREFLITLSRRGVRYWNMFKPYLATDLAFDLCDNFFSSHMARTFDKPSDDDVLSVLQSTVAYLWQNDTYIFDSFFAALILKKDSIAYDALKKAGKIK